MSARNMYFLQMYALRSSLHSNDIKEITSKSNYADLRTAHENAGRENPERFCPVQHIIPHGSGSSMQPLLDPHTEPHTQENGQRLRIMLK